ncbi:MAG: helix-turn-helix transcriptional regulator [Erysipelotrichaceae bacterium]|jgi:transcriptional regulator with XRE-family HTH domain|nr:helix-turn-helix transcriptional regulator [Erysipelotrichaceae bacterium]
MVIGEKIAELRKKYNYTQEKLAEKIGVTRQTISNWESNITSPDLNQASLLCKELRININDLLDNELELEVRDNSSSVLSKLVGRKVILNFDYDNYYDMDIEYQGKVTVLSIDDEFIKVEINKGKQTISKLIDMNLVNSIKVIEEN